jgi:methylmalonyl-CoA mutase N-terminal domain/subunit
VFRPDPAGRKEVLRDLEAVRRERDPSAVEGALGGLREAARGEADLMRPILACVETYATLGEICAVLEEQFGVHDPENVL